jgi:hypothetical protein
MRLRAAAYTVKERISETTDGKHNPVLGADSFERNRGDLCKHDCTKPLSVFPVPSQSKIQKLTVRDPLCSTRHSRHLPSPLLLPYIQEIVNERLHIPQIPVKMTGDHDSGQATPVHTINYDVGGVLAVKPCTKDSTFYSFNPHPLLCVYCLILS